MLPAKNKFNHFIRSNQRGNISNLMLETNKKLEISHNNETTAAYPKVPPRSNLKEYLYNSTLHGLRYMGDETISIFERFEIFI